MKDPNYISNTSPLIGFMKKKELDLLKLLFEELYIPQAVYNELTRSDKQANQVKGLKEAIKEGWIKVKKVKQFTIPDLNLGRGEKEAINLSLEMENALLLIDEKKGSSIAKTFKIKTLGTLGILILSKRKGVKTKKGLLKNVDTLISNNFYLSSEVITKFFKAIE